MKKLNGYRFRDDSRDSDQHQDFAKGGHLFRPLVAIAWEYHFRTNRYLTIWGELGELYVEKEYGMKRNKVFAQGFDGRIGNDLVEVKTISPDKKVPSVKVKSSSSFNVLIVVRVDHKFQFSARWIERSELKNQNGQYLSYHWNDKV